MFLLLACSPPPDLTSVELTLGTTSAIAYAGAHAAGWARGEALACDDASGTKDAWSGTTTISPDCAGPAVGGASGSVSAAGRVEADGSGELAADFAGAEGLRPTSVEAFVMTADDSLLTVVFAGVDVGLDDGVSLGETALVTEVDPGDPADGTDDVYTVSGGAQLLHTVGDEAVTDQLVLVDVVFDAACGANPVAGSVTVQRADTTDSATIDELQLAFHPACDGTVDVVLAVGASAASTGSAVRIAW